MTRRAGGLRRRRRGPPPAPALAATKPGGADPDSHPLASHQIRDRSRYEILAEHGRGGLGRVSRARDRELVRDVAINHQKTSTQNEWLAIHRRNHPNAADYPRANDRGGNENIYTFHTALRAEHSRNRRYKNGRSP